ncbi:hypothetical protein JVT61DRAFT_12128 [Boletus reticuloceps]|uniref:Uncharacterized protein n=1 Tax=Boletus reticuloceps TaxID=495285 RepID=A0A8I2YEK6_9AGAM|nr:hypothetical protein JVT61DRAFT_12128 [Boletus reticuloceps]
MPPDVRAPTTQVTVTGPITQIVHDCHLDERDHSEPLSHSVHPRFNILSRQNWRGVGTCSNPRKSPHPVPCREPASSFMVPTDVEPDEKTEEEEIGADVHPRFHRSLRRKWTSVGALQPPPYDPIFTESTNDDRMEWETEERRADEFDRSEAAHSPPPSPSPSSGISWNWNEQTESTFAPLPCTTPSPTEGLLVGCTPHTTQLCSTSTRGGSKKPPDLSSTLSILDPLRSRSEGTEDNTHDVKRNIQQEENRSRDSAIVLDERRPFPSPKKGRKKTIDESEPEGKFEMKVEANTDPSSPYDFESVTLIVLSQNANTQKDTERRQVRTWHRASTSGRSKRQRSIVPTPDDAIAGPSHVATLRSSDPQHIKVQASALSSWLEDLATLCERADASVTSPHRNVLDGMNIIQHLDENMDEMENIKKELQNVRGETSPKCRHR